MFTVVLTNKGSRTDVTPAWLAAVAAAVTAQIANDFAPDYGCAAWTVTTEPTPGALSLQIQDLSPQPDVEGYHDDADATPEAFVFTSTETLDEISVCISHEVLEMIRDLDAAGFRLGASGIAYADEACDAVEDTSYRINGIAVSNFVTQAWYVGGSAGPWDHLAILKGPMTRTGGGYTIQLAAGTVSTDPADASRATARRAHPQSRVSRRLGVFQEACLRLALEARRA